MTGLSYTKVEGEEGGIDVKITLTRNFLIRDNTSDVVLELVLDWVEEEGGLEGGGGEDSLSVEVMSLLDDSDLSECTTSLFPKQKPVESTVLMLPLLCSCPLNYRLSNSGENKSLTSLTLQNPLPSSCKILSFKVSDNLELLGNFNKPVVIVNGVVLNLVILNEKGEAGGEVCLETVCEGVNCSIIVEISSSSTSKKKR